MEHIATTPVAQRDIRSASVVRLRHASKRSKYGGKPPTDAFLVEGTRFPDQVCLGKPIQDLTAAEKLRVAQRSVGSLIGKRVNRHNQRTGENDPWRYWGAGRRWGKLEKKGSDVAREGVKIMEDEEDEDKRVDHEMEAFAATPVPRRDIRSSSVDRLRHSSQFAKYGGKLPTEAFLLDCLLYPSCWDWHKGKRVQDFTPAEKLRMTKGATDRLIAKRDNRHNQRTGENDPSRGRNKWEKRERKQRGVARDDLEIWKNEEDKEDEEERVDWGNNTETFNDVRQRRESDAASQEFTYGLDQNGAIVDLEVAAAGKEAGRYSFKDVLGKRETAKQEDCDGQWEFVHLPQGSKETFCDDDWDLLSTFSAP